MEFNKEINDYLTGEKFSNGLSVKISQSGEPIFDRFQIIESLCTSKNIIHLGCVDHLQLINKKIEQDLWLHARLCRSAEKCLGIDINREGINFLKKDLGYSDVICGDITAEDINEIKENSWDFLVMGEILEHVDDPVHFLSQIREKYHNNIRRLIITVPNAFSWQNITYTFSHSECINTDHRYWFTPFTLAKVVSQAGMSVEQFSFCQSVNKSQGILSWILHPKRIFHQILFSQYPATRLTLLMVVKVDR